MRSGTRAKNVLLYRAAIATPRARGRQPFLGGVLCGLVVVLLGCLFINYAGLQEDESAFAAPVFRDWSFYSITLGHARVPLMQMSYVGSLKTWVYAPLFWLWPPTPLLIRLPALLIGALTIVLFGWLLERAHGRRAAWIGSVLLASDSVFLLATTFDWGPVALQHLLTVAAMLVSVLWFQTRRKRWLVTAGFCCGLALWDKAVFAWVLGGLLAGSLLFLRPVRSRITFRHGALAAGALLAGALPLVIYNSGARSRLATIRSHPQVGTATLSQKLIIMHLTWNGFGLFPYLLADAPQQPGAPRTPLEKASFLLHRATGDHRSNAIEPALLLAILLIPSLWHTRARNAVLFSLIAFGVAWIFMLATGGGGSLHHTILLWPLPQLFLAVAFAEASRHVPVGRWLFAGLVGFLAITNLAVTNQYLFEFIRDGPSQTWTDAIYALAAGVHDTPATQLMMVGWGAEAPLCVLNRNRPPVRTIDASSPSSGLRPLLADQEAIWVEQMRSPASILDSARAAGYDPVIVATYLDRHGRPMFRTYRFQPATHSPQTP